MDKNTTKTSFGKWIEPICNKQFYELVSSLSLDRYIKKFTSFDYIKLMLHAQLQKRNCLREIVADLLLPEFQNELNMDSISASQLCRRHNQFDSVLLESMFQYLVGLIQTKQVKNPSFLQKDLRIIDSTTISMCLNQFRWASFRETKAGIKVHTRVRFLDDSETVYPDRIRITNADQHDRSQLEHFVAHDYNDTTYVFDRGYIDFAVFDQYSELGTFFVSRIKSNTIIETEMTFDVVHPSIQSDAMVYLGKGLKRTANAFRLIKTTDSNGNPIEIISNHYAKDAEEIAEMYRSRWAIETFFKWLKQHVEIKSLYGTSQTAVFNQIWIALIAFCLTLLMKLDEFREENISLLDLIRKLKVIVWKSFNDLTESIQRKSTRRRS